MAVLVKCDRCGGEVTSVRLTQIDTLDGATIDVFVTTQVGVVAPQERPMDGTHLCFSCVIQEMDAEAKRVADEMARSEPPPEAN